MPLSAVPRAGPVVLVALLVASAGCLGPAGESVGEDPLEETANASPANASDANETGDANDTSSGDDGGQAGNRTANRSRDNATADNDTAGEDADANETDDDAANETTYPPWPSPAEASIRPGVRVFSEGQCTSNFLFRTPDNATLMLGVAAHCVASEPLGATSGCDDGVEPLQPGAQVGIEGADNPGHVVYSAWWTMQQMENPSEDACLFNDFALVAVNASDRAQVNPAVEGLGGPTGLAGADEIQFGDRVQWHGSTGATPETAATSRHEGVVAGSGNWSFQTYSVLPGVFGDSGSGIMLEDGRAAGVLSTVNFLPPGANGITKLDLALEYAREHADLEVELVTWSQLDPLPLP